MDLSTVCYTKADTIIYLYTVEVDRMPKLSLYTKASVREYWIVDPQNQNIHVYNLEPDKFSVKVYTFHDTVKAGICEDLLIDFAAFDLDDLYENV